ncbi:NAD(+) diphosphatase [Microbulbifer thermotolerans]|uniref:NAD(+) diphosphatase n=1 Tax=Microbulbifer thermotolerans TaxID=252514 RepID=A0A143HLX0_MICTH|nr:NAD(+) diphosphatase [Microbulbifer thermotolerans]AMX02725.1 NADH pyrophosphatase [Microbulbifer thermotolerans]MCX2794556.1 NAD(+) diphosphatase [Microbulbifer thermotolerans]MCX2831645.1 NAD(+) diphosphatase [Microbulbifer thermotolerans]MCX2833948.1 NAD(+) diphosphatase [Microbulbifer thermotolerans]WKT59194.1 NAD(+) diphosphatase [Microbulbifer thermotolerans]
MSDIFVPAARVLPLPPLTLHILVADGQLLCRGDSFLHAKPLLPAAMVESSHYLGELRGEACGVHQIATPADVEGCEWRSLRSLLGRVDDLHFALAGRALQVVDWDINHRFCGRCGRGTEYHPRDRARVCRDCNLAVYPRISPCVIMLVTRGDECLLARHTRHPRGIHTALAGFIEPGENAEQALAREVREEVGLEVGKSRYIGSQSWPFPGQLMLGYHTEWTGGALVPDREEIAEAGWFHYSALPEIPPPQTLSGQLIRLFAKRASGEKRC